MKLVQFCSASVVGKDIQGTRQEHTCSLFMENSELVLEQAEQEVQILQVVLWLVLRDRALKSKAFKGCWNNWNKNYPLRVILNNIEGNGCVGVGARV